jgi:hypothetical protein
MDMHNSPRRTRAALLGLVMAAVALLAVGLTSAAWRLADSGGRGPLPRRNLPAPESRPASAATAWAADEPYSDAGDGEPEHIDGESGLDAPGKRVRIGDLRRRFPLVDLAPALEYESRAAAAPRLTRESEARLARFEAKLAINLGRGYEVDPKMLDEIAAEDGPPAVDQRLWPVGQPTEWSDAELAMARHRTLSAIYSMDVDSFVNTEGFGVFRIRPMASTRYLQLPEAPPIPFELTAASADEGDAAVAARAAEPSPGRSLVWPNGGDLLAFHEHSHLDFANAPGFGLPMTGDGRIVSGLAAAPEGRSPQNQRELLVAGFQPHHFRRRPELKPAGNPAALRQDRWLIRRLELLGMWKHAQPAIYVSESLPKMSELDGAPTRPLDPFETAALERLRAGEDLVTQVSVNRIRMLGALRAGKQCLECHGVPRGQLLGAFSYELLRDPPAPTAPVTARPGA